MQLHSFNHARPDLAPYGFSCELWKAAPMRRPDRHNEIELNLLRRGSLTYLLGGGRVTLPWGRLGAFWAAIPHQIIASEDHPEYFVVTLPLVWFLDCRLPEGLVEGLLHGQFVVDPNPERYPLDQWLCERWERDLGGPRREPPTATLLELQARLHRLADDLPARPPEARARPAMLGTGGLSKGEQMAAYIARHYQERVVIEDLARAVQLHPNYAMSLFKRTFRMTLVDYLTQYRVSHAQRLLATTDRKIVDVALDSGYATLSRFYEAFARACGCSPKQYRNQHRTSQSPSVHQGREPAVTE